MAISLDQAFRRFDTLHPAFRAARVSELIEWQPDAPPATLVMAEYARALSEHLSSFTQPELRSVFELVEELLIDANESTKDVVATGFIEALQSLASAGEFDFSPIRPLLGRRTRDYCQAWDRFTGTSTPGLNP